MCSNWFIQVTPQIVVSSSDIKTIEYKEGNKVSKIFFKGPGKTYCLSYTSRLEARNVFKEIRSSLGPNLCCPPSICMDVHQAAPPKERIKPNSLTEISSFKMKDYTDDTLKVIAAEVLKEMQRRK